MTAHLRILPAQSLDYDSQGCAVAPRVLCRASAKGRPGRRHPGQQSPAHHRKWWQGMCRAWALSARGYRDDDDMSNMKLPPIRSLSLSAGYALGDRPQGDQRRLLQAHQEDHRGHHRERDLVPLPPFAHPPARVQPPPVAGACVGGGGSRKGPNRAFVWTGFVTTPTSPQRKQADNPTANKPAFKKHIASSTATKPAALRSQTSWVDPSPRAPPAGTD